MNSTITNSTITNSEIDLFESLYITPFKTNNKKFNYDLNKNNSLNYYIKFRNQYLSETNSNFILYKQYLLDLLVFTNNNQNNHFTFFDQNEITQLKYKIKIILINQNKLLYNFKHFINLLKTEPENFKDNFNQSKKKNFLTKMFELKSKKL